MAVWVYKDEDKELVDALALPAMLQAGWRVTKEEEDDLQEEKGTDDAEEKAELEALKAEAKERGIKGYGRMSIDTLKEKLSDD